jgi:hypothetical protein
MKYRLDYQKMLILDAEDLAEAGIRKAYESTLPTLRQYLPEPAQVQEVVDTDAPSYLVRCPGQDYIIYSPALPEDGTELWGRATRAFFQIINDQLIKSEYRLYAINGGNDLGGMFLSQPVCAAARKSLPRKEGWPYLPTLEHPWYGQHHG